LGIFSKTLRSSRASPEAQKQFGFHSKNFEIFIQELLQGAQKQFGFHSKNFEIFIQELLQKLRNSLGNSKTTL
jgi:hypothetical protein